MQKKIFFNAKSSGKFKEVTFANRKHLVVEALALEGDTVMNGIFYPMEVVRNSFKQLDRKPAPIGHPSFNGQPISPNDPIAQNQFSIGAFVMNARMDGKRVKNDIYFDIEKAEESEKGRGILAKIRNGDKLGVSTGGEAILSAQNGANYKFQADVLNFDHEAILDGEDPAGANTYIQNSETEVVDLDTIEVIHNSTTTTEGNSMADFESVKLINAVVQNSAYKGNAADLEGLSEAKTVDAIIANTVKEVTYDEAMAVVEAKGMVITNHSKADLEAFDAYKADLAKVRGEKIEAIVSNSALSFEYAELEVMADSALDKIQNSMVKTADFSGQAETHIENSDKESFGEGL